MKILNLYAGIGGNRKLWEDVEVTAIEYDPKIARVYKQNFPNDIVIVADAHQFLLDHYKVFDFIWTSPPCPSHSKIRISSAVARGQNNAIYPQMELYEEIIFLKHYYRGKYVVENVKPYYEPLIKPTKELQRHIFWANFRISKFNVTNVRKHANIKSNSIIYGFDLKDKDIDDKIKTLRNMVDPELGLYILDCARNIIRQNSSQKSINFDF
jgi:DNA (cytosine-5)-methyltransferase 1